MTAAAPILGNLFLSLAAIAGLAILHGALAARDPWEPINRRFLFGVRVMILLFAGRALEIVTGSDFFRFLVLLGAALIPLAVLLLAEGLLRRHAPPWAKTWVAAGTAVFSLLSLWFGDQIDPARLAALMLFQLSGFAIGGWMVLTRDKASLSASENRTVERLALSLLLLVPLAAADFLIVVLDLPAQVSPLGVLFLCWLAISLGRGQGQHRSALGGFLVIALAAGLATVFLALMAGMDRDGVILSLAVILSAVMVAVLFIEARTLKAEERAQGLLSYLAGDRSDNAVAFLRGLQAHPMVEGALILTPEDLADLDEDVLLRLLGARPVLRRTDPAPTRSDEADHMTHLFDRYAASHILLASEAPLTIVALSMPALASSPRAEIELDVVQRFAERFAR